MKGQVLNAKLLQAGVSELRVAELLGISQMKATEILSSDNVKIDTIKKLSEKLNLPIVFFLDEDNVNWSKFRKTEDLGDKVMKLLDSQGKSYSQLLSFVKKTSNGLKMMFRRDTCNITVLVKLAEFFDVDLEYFLPRKKASFSSKEDKDVKEELIYLRGKVEGYERAFKVLSTIFMNTSPEGPLAFNNRSNVLTLEKMVNL